MLIPPILSCKIYTKFNRQTHENEAEQFLKKIRNSMSEITKFIQKKIKFIHSVLCHRAKRYFFIEIKWLISVTSYNDYFQAVN